MVSLKENMSGPHIYMPVPGTVSKSDFADCWARSALPNLHDHRMTVSTGEGRQRKEMGSDYSLTGLLGLPAILCTDQGLFRQELESRRFGTLRFAQPT